LLHPLRVLRLLEKELKVLRGFSLRLIREQILIIVILQIQSRNSNYIWYQSIQERLREHHGRHCCCETEGRRKLFFHDKVSYAHDNKLHSLGNKDQAVVKGTQSLGL